MRHFALRRAGSALLSLALLSAFPVSANIITIETPGCVTDAPMTWDGVTLTATCLGAPNVPMGAIHFPMRDCAADTALGLLPGTRELSCLPALGAPPVTGQMVALALPFCVGPTWHEATSTLSCPALPRPAQIAVTAGGSQSAPVTGAFDRTLVAVVRDANGNPLPGQTVGFVVPGSGPSAGLTVWSTTTNYLGEARASAVANATEGAYKAVASNAALTVGAEFDLANTAAVRPETPSINADRSVASHYDALTDGLLVTRFLSGLRGPALTVGALGPDAQRTDPGAIAEYLTALGSALDVDNSGQADGLTDGLLIMRYLFGLRGPGLIAGAMSSSAVPPTAEGVIARIQALMP